MKKLVLSTLSVAAALALSLGVASAQYQPNFNTFNGSSTLSGQPAPFGPDSWDTNDGNQPDFVGVVPGYSATSSDYWALLGGLGVGGGPAPDVVTTDLWRTFTLPWADNASFSTKMAISSSLSPQTAQDTFQWKFRGGSGEDIVSIDFTPVSASTLLFQWTDDGGQHSSSFGIDYNAKYDLIANVTHIDGAANLEVLARSSGIGSYTTFYNGSFTPLNAVGVEQVAPSWTLSNSTVSGNGTYDNYGNNSLLFQDYSVTPVPESSVVMLALGAGLAFLLVRRVRKQTA